MKGKSFLLFAMLWLPSITGVLYADGDKVRYSGYVEMDEGEE